jgi:hypothetical protein
MVLKICQFQKVNFKGAYCNSTLLSNKHRLAKERIKINKENNMKLKVKTNRPLSNVLVGVFILSLVILVHSPLSARLVINYSGCAFEYNCDEGDAGINTIYRSANLSSLIVNGAGYFLKANSEILLFSHKFELAELYYVDFSEFQEILDSAIINMENARDTYVNLNAVAKSTPYQKAFIQKLMEYDYEMLQKKRGFCTEIYNEIRHYLSGGDVRGYYISFQIKLEDLLNKLYMIKKYIDAGTFPPVADVWVINQKCSEAMMSGLYAAEIFFNNK